MTDLSRRLCLKKCLERAAGRYHLFKIRRSGVVDLIKVDIIGSEVLEADVNVIRHRFLGARHALGRKHELFAHALERVAEIFLAYGISARGVDKIDAFLYHIGNESLRALGVDLLYRNSAKSEAGYLESCFS